MNSITHEIISPNGKPDAKVEIVYIDPRHIEAGRRVMERDYTKQMRMEQLKKERRLINRIRRWFLKLQNMIFG